MACTSVGGRGLAHHGMLHSASADMAATLAPLAAERLTRGEPVLAVLPTTTADRLRARLPTVEGLHTTDPSELYRHPGRVLRHYRAWIANTRPDGGPATIIAAPNLNGNDVHQATLWMHIDAVTTLALGDYDLTLVCVYPDDPATTAAVRGAHPSMLNGGITPSTDHLSAEQFVARYPLPPPIELGEPEATHTLDHPTQLHGLRQAVAGHAADAGIPSTRCDDFVLAVTEIATNALDHGAPPITLRLWCTCSSVICEIIDHGRFTQPLAGLRPPPTNQRRGRGLWMAHQLCDEFYLWPHPTTIRLQMDRPAAVLPSAVPL
jgi:anti-sigma regulatory factor (Ser/Thr protein kinase)